MENQGHHSGSAVQLRHFTSWEKLLLCKEYALNYRRMSKFPYNHPEEISEFQLAKVKELVSLAFYHTSFYRRLYTQHGVQPEDIKTWSDFEKLPSVSKSDIIENHADVIVDTKRGQRNLRVSRSSGSSGHMLNIVADSDRWIQSALLMLRMYSGSFGFSPFSKGALIYTSKYPFQSAWGLYKVHYLHTLTPPEDLMRSLERVKPTFIISYPSILSELAANYPRNCRALKVGALATNSEHSTQEQRDSLSAAFDCPVFDEYSTEELILGGFQCTNRAYHLQEDCAYFEILDPDSSQIMNSSQIGEIVGTCLVNRVMPFIRYRQGDLGSIRKSDCPCGNNGRILSDIAGRKNSSFKLMDGRVIPSGRVLDWTYKLVLEYQLPITQFQITQRTVSDIDIAIVVGPEYLPRRLQLDSILNNSFKEEFGQSLTVRINQVQSIPRTPAGKHIPIRSFVE
jgi:phenylacetate-CoA ligase